MVDKRFFIENSFVFVLKWKQPNSLMLPNRPKTEDCHLIVCSEKKARETYADFKRDEQKKKKVCTGLYKEFADGSEERIA